MKQTGELKIGFHHEVHGGEEQTVIDLSVAMTDSRQLQPHYGPVAQIDLTGHFDLTIDDFILQ